jgi:hypothetical protein
MDSPVIPLSPDPFSRYPSEAEASRLQDERDSKSFGDDVLPQRQSLVPNPPDRSSSLTIPSANSSRPSSQTPSSRFSIDSSSSGELVKSANAPQNKSSSIIGMKNIRKLWRRSDSKRASVSTQAQPESGRSSPNTALLPPPIPNSQPSQQPPPSGRSRGKSISKSSIIPPPMQGLQIPGMVPRDNMRSLRFDQESPYPIHPSNRASAMRSPSPPPVPVSRPASQQALRPPQPESPQPPGSAPLPGMEKSGARKSILKSWRSGNFSTGSNKGSISSTGSRSSNEQPREPTKKRRPSMLDKAAGAMRSSLSIGSAASLGDLPPSPALPEQYAQHARSSSRQSGSGRPSMSSNPSASSPPRVRSPLMAGSPPHNGLSAGQSRVSRTSVDSYESRPSFDASQFEIVSPPHGSLTYPYNSLDQSTLSSRE